MSTELNTLQTYVGEATGGSALKEVGTTHWTSPNTNASNSTGFTAVGSGVDEASLKDIARFWSSTEVDSSNAYYLVLSYDGEVCGVSSGAKTQRHSVRLIKD